MTLPFGDGTAIDALLNDSATIQKHEMSSGSLISFVYTNVSTSVPCMLQPLSAKRDTLVMGKFPTSTHRLFLRSTWAIQAGNRVVLAGKIYTVESVEDYFGHHFECVLTQKTIPHP